MKYLFCGLIMIGLMVVSGCATVPLQQPDIPTFGKVNPRYKVPPKVVEEEPKEEQIEVIPEYEDPLVQEYNLYVNLIETHLAMSIMVAAEGKLESTVRLADDYVYRAKEYYTKAVYLHSKILQKNLGESIKEHVHKYEGDKEKLMKLSVWIKKIILELKSD